MYVNTEDQKQKRDGLWHFKNIFRHCLSLPQSSAIPDQATPIRFFWSFDPFPTPCLSPTTLTIFGSTPTQPMSDCFSSPLYGLPDLMHISLSDPWTCSTYQLDPLSCGGLLGSACLVIAFCLTFTMNKSHPLPNILVPELKPVLLIRTFPLSTKSVSTPCPGQQDYLTAFFSQIIPKKSQHKKRRKEKLVEHSDGLFWPENSGKVNQSKSFFFFSLNTFNFHLEKWINVHNITDNDIIFEMLNTSREVRCICLWI